MGDSPAGIDPSLVRRLLGIVDIGGDSATAGTARGKDALWGALSRPLSDLCRSLGADILYAVMPGETGWLKIGFGPDGERGRIHLPRVGGITRHVLSHRGRLVQSRQPSDSGMFQRYQDGWPKFETTSYIAVPIHHGGRTRGVLVLLRGEGRPPFGIPDLGGAELVAEAIGIRSDNEERMTAMGRLARTDGLTQLANYRCLREILPQAFARASRLSEPLSIVMVDVDNLKSVNDRYGHLAGSDVLRKMGRVLGRYIRGDDVVAKYGGDEFVIVLPGATSEGAVIVAERVREAVGREVTGPTPEDRISCSCGIASYPDDGADYVSLISAADRALFRAKLRGRNAVVISGGRRDAEAVAAEPQAGEAVAVEPEAGKEREAVADGDCKPPAEGDRKAA